MTPPLDRNRAPEPPLSPEPSPPAQDGRAVFGLRMIRGGLAIVGAFIAVAGTWTLVQAARNPDVRARRPRWLDPATPFDWSFWTPVIVCVIGGALLVGAVFWRAYRRMQAGEDLYAARSGRGLRRRGERFLDDAADAEAP
ncbi:MAG: hypothetical protein ACK41D_05935 [Rubricoccaceae bacterium]